MDSDGDDHQRDEFAKQGGEALNLDDGADFNDSEPEDDDDMEVPIKKSSPSTAPAGAGAKDVKGEKLDN